MTAYPGAIASSQVDAESYIDTVLAGQWTDIVLSTIENASGSPDIIGLDPLAEVTFSSDASWDITSIIDGTYDLYIIELVDFVPATNGVDLWLRTSANNGSTWNTGASDYQISASGDSKLILASGMGSASGEGASAIIHCWNPYGTALDKQFDWNVSFDNSTSYPTNSRSSGAYVNSPSTAQNAVQILCSSGNIESGTGRIYGRRT
jgi:hypothetical protein